MENADRKVASISDRDFGFICSTIYSECGIKLCESKKALVEARLMRRLRELKLPGYSEYCSFVKVNYGDEIVNLINCITTNKTEFFRESYHFDYLRKTVLPQYQLENKKKIRIWSAGCSTGEEAYTIAISILDHYGPETIPDIKILATDIDTRVLETARSGIYRNALFSNLDKDMIKKYFLKGKNSNSDFYCANDRLKKIISFRRLNLLEQSLPMKGPFDIIFCRNVIIYFDRESQKKLISQFHRYLEADSYLFMGHSEALSGLTQGFYSAGRSIYRRI